MRAIFQHMRYAELFGHYTRILGRLTRVFVIDEDARHADHVETRIHQQPRSHRRIDPSAHAQNDARSRLHIDMFYE